MRAEMHVKEFSNVFCVAIYTYKNLMSGTSFQKSTAVVSMLYDVLMYIKSKCIRNDTYLHPCTKTLFVLNCILLEG